MTLWTCWLAAGLVASPVMAVAGAQGAAVTGQYRNLFVEAGHPAAEVEARLAAAWSLYFESEDPDQRLLWSYGPDEAYILNPATDNAQNPVDVRSEGQSYGMFIAVQLDKQDAFDRLWNFARRRMLHTDGPREGYFCWHYNPTDTGRNPHGCISPVPAPDGEIYLAAALYLADGRWGSTPERNYRAWADEIAREMLHQENDNGGVVDGVTNMFDAGTDLVVFVPNGSGAGFSDPSYHLPHLFHLFSLRGPETDRARWASIRDRSRDYLAKVAQRSPVCLAPEYASFEGEPQVTAFNPDSHHHVADAWRVVHNVAMDYSWWRADARQVAHVDCVLGFFADPARGGSVDGYVQRYDVQGTRLDRNYPHGGGQAAMNGSAALAATRGSAFISDLWRQAAPTGRYRYYHGLLYMLGMLAASGQYRLY